jgi:hypothetical protein
MFIIIKKLCRLKIVYILLMVEFVISYMQYFKKYMNKHVYICKDVSQKV